MSPQTGKRNANINVHISEKNAAHVRPKRDTDKKPTAFQENFRGRPARGSVKAPSSDYRVLCLKMGGQRGVFRGGENSMSKAIKAGSHERVWGALRSVAQQVAV